MKLIPIILSVFVLFSGCINKRKFIYGCYQTKGAFELGSRFCIENDSVFSYNWKCGLAGGETKGIWKVIGSKLILNSELQPIIDTTGDYKLRFKKRTNSDFCTFELYEPYENLKLEGANGFVYKNGEIINTFISNKEGIIRVPKEPLDSIVISFIGLKVFTIHPDIYDFYSIMMNKSTYAMYEFFTNEEWRIRKNSLIDKEISGCNYGKKLKRYKNKNSTTQK